MQPPPCTPTLHPRPAPPPRTPATHPRLALMLLRWRSCDGRGGGSGACCVSRAGHRPRTGAAGATPAATAAVSAAAVKAYVPCRRRTRWPPWPLDQDRRPHGADTSSMHVGRPTPPQCWRPTGGGITGGGWRQERRAASCRDDRCRCRRDRHCQQARWGKGGVYCAWARVMVRVVAAAAAKGGGGHGSGCRRRTCTKRVGAAPPLRAWAPGADAPKIGRRRRQGRGWQPRRVVPLAR